MTATATNERLNDLLVELSRSLLQFAGEAYPWAAEHDTSGQRSLLERLVKEQQDSVRALVAYLSGSGHSIDFGVYPDEYTSLFYVSLDWLIRQIVINQTAIVADLRQGAQELASDADASSLLHVLADREQAILEELKRA
ncbi:MAG: hypothetical protein R3B90_04240 [Planctomycetaceae bacterium]